MKKYVAVSLVFLVLALCIATICTQKTQDEFLRIHIRANSNSQTDQNVKYAVRDAVCDFLTPYAAQAESKNRAVQSVCDLLSEIQAVADKVLCANGFSYGAKAKISREQFPTRCYDGVTLQSGVYDALIVELGSGEGDNWWCVVYPPLCFVGGEFNGSKQIVFKSKLKEIIDDFFDD